jgi:hypothetical protein
MNRGAFTALAAAAAFLSTSFLETAASAAPPAPSGAHPRIFLTPTVKTALDAKKSDTSSQTARVIKMCDDYVASPTKVQNLPGAGLDWGVAATACAFAWQFTQKAEHAAVGITLLKALLDDYQKIGDAAGGDEVVRHDTGYFIRLYGPYSALAFDWLHEAPGMDTTLKAHAIARFKAWVDWYTQSGYLKDQPGANYHAGYVFAKTMIGIAISNEDPAGATYFTDVVDNIFTKQLVGKGLAAGGVLQGGDWSEGWQYGPLSVMSYSLSARALAEQGATFPEIDAWSNDLALRMFHAQAPSRTEGYVGGDFDDSALNVKPHPRMALATLVGPSTDEAAGWALFARQNFAKGNEQIAFVDALAETRKVTAADLGSPTASKWYLAKGPRRLYMRSGWDAAANWAVFSSSPHQVPDHEHPDASNINFYRGADALIVDPSIYGSFSTLPTNALTVESNSVGDDYKPSQAVWPNKADLPWSRAGESGIIAARSDLKQAFLGPKGAASDVPYVHREFTFLPEGDLVLIDRARTDDAARSMRIRFHAPQAVTLSGNTASADIGGSTLRIVGADVAGKTATTRMSPKGDDCSIGTRGTCELARFNAGEYDISIPGPDARAVHVISGTAKGDAAPQVLSINDATVDPGKNPTVLGAVVTRGTLRTVVVGSSAKDGAAGASLAYLVPAGGSRNVVFDAPESADGSSTVVAAKEGDLCRITITPANGAGFAGRPLMFTVGTQSDPCAISEDKNAPPGAAPLGPPGGGAIPGAAPPGGPGGPNGGPGAGGGKGDDSGCGCSAVGRPVQSVGLAIAMAALVGLGLRRRQSRSR